MTTTAPQPPARLTPLYWLVLALGAAWMIYLGVNSPGTPLHDEIAHYRIAHTAWTDPAYLLDIWGRPGNTLFYFLPSALDVGARRVWALAACLLIALILTRTAARLRLRRLEFVPLFLFLQPWYGWLGFTSITQIPFMLFLTLGIHLWVTRRLAWASLCFGLLAITRHEGIALTGAWGLYLIGWWLSRRGGLSFVRLVVSGIAAALPMLVWNGAYLLVFGRLASGNLLDVRPTDIYGSGSWFHFFIPLVASVGLAVFILALLGVVRVWRERRGILIYAVPALLYYLVHTIIYRYGLFASGGYILFLLPVAPTFALLAAFGTERLPEWIENLQHRWLSGLRREQIRAGAAAVIVGAGLLYNGAAALAVGTWRLQPNEVGAQQAEDWLRAQDGAERVVYTTHIWFDWIYRDTGRSVYIAGGAPKPTAESIALGDYYLWDKNYSDLNGFTLDQLRAPGSGFTEVQRFEADEIILFRRE